MKIQFVRSVTVDVEKPRLGEMWDRQFNKWDEIYVEGIYPDNKEATIQTPEGDYLIGVPLDSFVELKEKKTPVLF